MSDSRTRRPVDSARRGRARRWAGAVLTGAVIAALIAVLSGLPLYVFPQRDEPRRVDAVIVLGPPLSIDRENPRFVVGERLVEAGHAEVLVVSVDSFGIDSAENIAPCHESRPYRVICATPEPFTTEGEAILTAELAAAHGWESVLVVTSTYHVARARFLFERCFAGEVLVADDGLEIDALQWVNQYLYQSAAFVKALLLPGCRP